MNSMGPTRPRRSVPVSRSVSRSSSSGQARVHTPHEWQSSGKTVTPEPAATTAPNWQTSEHSPQPEQSAPSSVGTRTV